MFRGRHSTSAAVIREIKTQCRAASLCRQATLPREVALYTPVSDSHASGDYPMGLVLGVFNG